MPMLECPGVFTMPFVPEGWTATSEEGGTFFELQPPSRDAAVHISVYRRTQLATPSDDDAAALLLKFARVRPTEGSPKVVVVPRKNDEQRAFAKYLNRGDDGKLTEWFAGCILWPSRMLICSCNAAPGHPALKEGEIMIASIFHGTGEDPGRAPPAHPR